MFYYFREYFLSYLYIVFELVCDRSPAKKTISSSSFLGWLAGRGAVKTLIDWYVRRRARRRYRNAARAAATKQHSMRQQWMVAGRWQSQAAAAVQCVCVCHRSSSKRAAAARLLSLPRLKNQVKAQ